MMYGLLYNKAMDLKWQCLQPCDDKKIDDGNERDCFQCIWARPKTGTTDELAFLPHATNWVSCCVHSIAAHAVHMSRSSDFMFPNYHASKHIDGIILSSKLFVYLFRIQNFEA